MRKTSFSRGGPCLALRSPTFIFTRFLFFLLLFLGAFTSLLNCRPTWSQENGNLDSKLESKNENPLPANGTPTPKEKITITIGTGGETGLYYPIGAALSKFINATESTHGLKLSAETTAGSVYNINAVMSGDLDFGIAQSDRQFQAYEGIADWKNIGKQEALRSLFSLHAEIVTLVASEESRIKSFEELKGKVVNIGDHGSGHRGNALDILASAGINWERDLRPVSFKASEAPKMLQKGRIDAFFYTVGHPNEAILEATRGFKKVRLIPIARNEKFLRKHPYYQPAVIPHDLYPLALNNEDIDSLGVLTTVVTSNRTPVEVVYKITKEIFERIEDLKKLHPSLASLSKASMLKGLTAPIHEGALKYYKEKGFMK
jgi:TRAP transporter TAXI family solute receptor